MSYSEENQLEQLEALLTFKDSVQALVTNYAGDRGKNQKLDSILNSLEMLLEKLDEEEGSDEEEIDEEEEEEDMEGEESEHEPEIGKKVSLADEKNENQKNSNGAVDSSSPSVKVGKSEEPQRKSNKRKLSPEPRTLQK